jgi:hypothetical protein
LGSSNEIKKLIDFFKQSKIYHSLIFSLEELIFFFRQNDKEVTDEQLKELIDSEELEIIPLVTPENTFIQRSLFYENAVFFIDLSDWEVNNGIILLGDKVLPFISIDNELEPILIDENDQQLKSGKYPLPISTLVSEFELFSQNKVSSFFSKLPQVDGKEDEEEALLCPVHISNTPLQKNMLLMLRVLDYNKGILRVEGFLKESDRLELSEMFCEWTAFLEDKVSNFFNAGFNRRQLSFRKQLDIIFSSYPEMKDGVMFPPSRVGRYSAKLSIQRFLDAKLIAPNSMVIEDQLSLEDFVEDVEELDPILNIEVTADEERLNLVQKVNQYTRIFMKDVIDEESDLPVIDRVLEKLNVNFVSEDIEAIIRNELYNESLLTPDEIMKKYIAPIKNEVLYEVIEEFIKLRYSEISSSYNKFEDYYKGKLRKKLLLIKFKINNFIEQMSEYISDDVTTSTLMDFAELAGYVSLELAMLNDEINLDRERLSDEIYKLENIENAIDAIGNEILGRI